MYGNSAYSQSTYSSGVTPSVAASAFDSVQITLSVSLKAVSSAEAADSCVITLSDLQILSSSDALSDFNAILSVSLKADSSASPSDNCTIDLSLGLAASSSAVTTHSSNIVVTATVKPQKALETQALSYKLPSYIELFEFDFTSANIPGLSGYFRCSSSRCEAGSVLFGGDVFICNFPIEISGVGFKAGDAPARPQLTITNVNKYFGSLASLYSDLAKTTVTYYRTFEPYLGLENKFSIQPLKFEIAKKLDHYKAQITFELRDPLDKERSFMPGEQMLRDQFPGLGVNKRVN